MFLLLQRLCSPKQIQAAPVTVGKEILAESQIVRGAIVNAGLANACTGAEGIEDCRESLILAAKYLGLNSRDLLPPQPGLSDRASIWKNGGRLHLNSNRHFPTAIR